MKISTPEPVSSPLVGGINYHAPALFLPCSRNPESNCYMIMDGQVHSMGKPLEHVIADNIGRKPIYKGIAVTLTF